MAYRPLRRRKAPNLVYLITSIGIFIFLQNLVQLLYGAQVLSVRTGPAKIGHQFMGAVVTDMQILVLAVSLVLMLVAWFLINRTDLGLKMRAVADDPVTASLLGVDAERIILLAMALGSVLGGAAGSLVSYETNLEPTMGMNAILKGIIASIIGGIGSIPGAVVGGLFLGVVENLGIWKINAGWKDCIAFSVLIAFLLIRPTGFFGLKAKGERV